MPIEERQTIDWSTAFKNLGSKVEGALNVRNEERKAFDQQALDASSEISTYEAGQNQTFNELVFNAADSGRNQIAEWTGMAKRGEITQADLKSRMNNLSTGLSGFAKSAKTYDQRMVEYLQRTQADENGWSEAGKLEGYLNENFAELADLKNQEYSIDPITGKGAIVKRDAEGNIISKQDANRVNNPGNMLGVKINLGSAVAGTVKNWVEPMIEVATRRGGSITTTDMEQAEGFAESLIALTGGILSDDRSIFSILADNSEGDYDLWQTEAEKKRKVDYRVEQARKAADLAGKEFKEGEFRALAEDQMVQARQDATGIIQPIITDKLKKRAEEIVKNSVMMQLKKQVSINAGWSPNSGGASSKTPKLPGDSSLYESAKKAWMAKGGNSEKMFETLTNNTYDFEWGSDGLNVYNIVEEYNENNYATGKKITDKQNPVLIGVKKLEDLSGILWGATNAAGYDQARKDFTLQRNNYNKKNPSGGFNAEDFYNQNK